MSSTENPTPDSASERSAEGLARLDLRRLWKDASWTTGSLAVSTLLAFAESILLARFLGAAAFGLFVLVRAYPEAVQQVLDCRTRETIVRYLGEFVALNERERAHAVVRLIWVVDAVAGLIAMAIVFATASVAARYVVHDSTMTGLVVVYAVSQFVGTLDSASGSVVRVFDRFGLASAMGVCRAVTRFIGVLAALLLGGGIASLVYVLVGVEVAYTLGSTGVSLSLLRQRIGFRLRGGIGVLGNRRNEMFRFLLHTNVAGTLKMSSEKLVLVIIGALGGTSMAAQFKVAAQAGSSLMLFSDPFYQVVYPSLSKMVARRQWDAIFDGVRKIRRTTLASGIPAAAVISSAMIPLIPLVFGEDFRPAVVPGIVIVWGMLPNVLFFWLRPLLLSLGQSGRLARYRGMASGLQLAATLLLIKPAGVIGAAASLFLMQWFYAVLEIRLVESWRRRVQQAGATG